MRFSRVSLVRYGHFGGADLAFRAPSPGGPDLHLVFGENEAGKSTVRNALVDFLFGFPKRTPYGFRFPMPQLEVAATIELAGEAMDLVRLKKDKDSLRFADGRIARPDPLGAALAGSDRAAFEREHALSHDDLPRARGELADYAADLSAQLFAAATGLGACVEHQAALARAAEALWHGDRRRRTRWSQVHADFDEAQKELRSREIRRSAYDALVREDRRAAGARALARAERDRLRQEKAHLERLARLAGPVARWRRSCAERDALVAAGVDRALLPEDASTRLTAARERIAVARSAREEACKRRQEAVDARAAIEVDGVLLAAGEAVDALAARAPVVESAAGEIAAAHAEVDAKRRQALDEARRIGLGAQTLEALSGAVADAASRADLRDAAGSRKALAVDAGQRSEELAALERKVAHETAALEALPPAQDLSAAREALAAARRLGDPERAREPLARALAEAQARLDRQLGALDPAPPDAAHLAGRTPPPQAAVEPIHAALARAEAEIDRLDRAIEAGQAERAKLRTELERRMAGTEVVEAADVMAARAERERIWRTVREGERAPAEAAPALEEATREADRLADVRFETAHLLGEREGAKSRIATLEGEESAHALERAARGKEREDALARWRTLLAGRGLPDVPLPRYGEWLRAREAVLEARDEASRARGELEAFDAGVRAALDGLRAALPPGATPPTRDTFDGWQTALEHALGAAEAVAHDRRTRSESLAERKAERDEGARKAATAGAALAAADERWRTLAARCSIPVDAGPERVRVMLEGLDRIDALLKAAKATERNEIERKQRETERFVADTAALVGRVAPHLGALEAIEAVRSLADLLKTARERDGEARRLRQAILAADERIARETAALADAEATLEPLRAAGRLQGDAGLDEIAAAAERSARFRALAAAVDEVETAIREEVGERPLAAAAEEVEAGDPAARRVAIEALAEDLARAEDALEAATGAARDASRALEAVDGGSAAGNPAQEAAARRARASGELAEIAADHLWAHLEARLLRWAIERYRAENQSPLVTRAGALFRTLTGGRYGRLEADETPRLLAIEAATGVGRTVEEMSSGTRDQLFLALRLAAAYLRAEAAGTPLPFIADDLFVNADDRRMSAGLEALATLSRRFQIVYLTHHAHVVEIARRVLGADLDVVHLDGTGASPPPGNGPAPPSPAPGAPASETAPRG